MALVFDVSTLLRWDRRLTGIPRVVAEVAEGIAAHPDVAFCRFDAVHRRWAMVETAEVLAQVRRLRLDALPGPAPRNAKRHTAVRRVARRALPGRSPAGRQVALAGRAALSSLGHLRRAVELARQRPAAPPPCATDDWGPGTTYVTLGLEPHVGDLELVHRRRAERGFRTVLCAYDLIPELHPELTGGWSPQHLGHLLDADALLAISANTEADLRRVAAELGRDVPPVTAFPLASTLMGLDPVDPGLGLDRFVLCVGTVEIRKNHHLLLDVWESMLAAGDAPPLVVAGHAGWINAETVARLSHTRAFAGVVHWLEGVSDAELAWLYAHCAFTVFPSRYEGWGMPVTESLDAAKVCLASDRSSMPEAGEGHAVLLDPLDRGAWETAIRRAWEDDAWRSERERALADRRPRTWSDACSAVLALV